MTDIAPSPWPAATPLYIAPQTASAHREAARDLRSWDLSPRQLCDLELLLGGALTPMCGYPSRSVHDQIVRDGHLPDGRPYPWPLALDVTADFAAETRPGERIALRDPEGLLVAIVDVDEVWEADRAALAALFPDTGAGAQWLAGAGTWRLSGPVQGIDAPFHYDFVTLRAGPAELGQRFARLGWRSVLAVVTDRPIGPGEHALITRHAREIEANVLILAEAGMSEPGDVRYYARLRALEAIMARFPEQTTELALLPVGRHLGTDRDWALRHLLARNYGATHVLTLDADGEDVSCAALDRALGLQALPSGRPVYQTDRGRFDVATAARQGPDDRPAGIGEMIEVLRRGDRLPEWLDWPELLLPLRRAWPPRAAQGFTLFLTGLSGSGKSTIARALLGRLMEEGSRRVTLLDGDIVRKNLSSELGFSREHRNLNILRIGFVAAEITKNGGIAICAPIAPYTMTRRAVRETVEAVGGFVEVHVATPLEVCEARDRKGLYAKARAGLIKEFTGISDPYEVPEHAEVRIDTADHSPDEAAQQILLKLAALGYL